MGNESQYGITFIPPYFSNYPAPPMGRNPNIYLPSGQYPPSTPGIGDHGYIGAPVPPDHVENTNVVFHHGIEYINNGVVVNPYIAAGNGGFTASLTTSTINSGQGIPWKTDQGVQDLWQQFFRSYYQISELEWNTESTYYHYLFGRFLSEFVMTFLPTLDAIQTNANLSTEDNYATKLSYATSIKSTFPLINTLIFADSTTIGNLNEVWNVIQDNAPPQNDPQKWFLGTDGTTTWYNDSPETLNKAWQLYLQASDVSSMAHSAYLWSYREILRMLGSLQSSLESQTGRLLVLGNSQEAAVNSAEAMAYISVLGFASDESSGAGSAIAANMYKSGSLEAYKTYQQIDGQYSSQQNSTLSGANNSINEQNSMMQTIMQQMGSLLQGIFNR